MGEVYAAETRGAEVAVKEIKELVQLRNGFTDDPDDEEVLKDFRKEVQLLESCRNVNVLMFIGYCFEPVGALECATRTYRLAIVTEYMARGSLWDNLHRRRVELRYSRRLRMLLDVTKGLTYLRVSNGLYSPLVGAMATVADTFSLNVSCGDTRTSTGASCTVSVRVDSPVVDSVARLR